MKWKRNILSQHGCSLVISINDADSVVPTQVVPQILHSPFDAFELTLPVCYFEMLLLFTNQKYNQYCQQNPRGSAVNRFRSYRPFSKE